MSDDQSFNIFDEAGMKLDPEMDIARDAVAFLSRHHENDGASFPLNDAVELMFQCIVRLDMKIEFLRRERE